MTTEFLSELNDRQREAVEAINGPLLIVAGPGSGKTRLITYRIAYLLRVVGLQPSRIAAVTFTNKAAREMKERIRSVTPYGSDRLTVGTFHAFCAQMLRRDGEAVGLDRNFAIYDDPDQLEMVKRGMRETDADPKQFSPRAIQSAISSAKSQLLTADGFTMRTASYFDEVVGRVYERYEALMAQSIAVDFDDLLLKTFLLLNDNDAVAEKYQDRYSQFMIDEFQDTNVAQYAIARIIARKHRNLCVVGDPDQSIYSWRNADIRNILSFQSDFPDAKVVALEQNYRSTQNILDAASRLISANSQRVEKELFTHNGVGERISISEGYDEQEEAQLVLREIGLLTRPKSAGPAPYRLGDIAVMYRVNAQSRALEEACRRYGVPYQLIGGMKFYQRQEVKDVAAYLRLLANSDDDVSLMRVVNLPPRGIGRRTLDELARLARDQGTSAFEAIRSISPSADLGGPLVSGPFTARAARALGDFRVLIEGLRAEAERVGIVELIEAVLERSGYRKYLTERDEQAEDRIDNINEFKAAAREFSELDMPDGLNAFLESVSLVSDIDSMEETPDALTLITLHQAKGLEYAVVFMVGMEDGLLPHARSLEEEAGLEEERRLCYVGMTRAKERLYLMRAFRRGFRGGTGPNLPSRFLLDIPRELVAGAEQSESQPSPPNGAGQADVSSGRRRTESPPRSRRERADQGFQFSRRTRATTTPEPTRVRRPGRSAVPQTRRRRSAPSAGGPPFATGDKVRHKAFGEGIVTSCEPSGADFQATVAFKDGGGIKRFLTSFAPLEKVE